MLPEAREVSRHRLTDVLNGELSCGALGNASREARALRCEDPVFIRGQDDPVGVGWWGGRFRERGCGRALPEVETWACSPTKMRSLFGRASASAG